ncbi:hypothetical protein ACDX78_06015 [Virgibacillus oceani]
MRLDMSQLMNEFIPILMKMNVSFFQYPWDLFVSYRLYLLKKVITANRNCDETGGCNIMSDERVGE